jgi:hypothetical protein
MEGFAWSLPTSVGREKIYFIAINGIWFFKK